MTDQRFKAGDLVVLKSGSFPMTVSCLRPNLWRLQTSLGDGYETVWMWNGKFERDIFSDAELEPYAQAKTSESIAHGHQRSCSDSS
jgi:uncharacterized protein YodC (DUF2158 family)